MIAMLTRWAIWLQLNADWLTGLCCAPLPVWSFTRNLLLRHAGLVRGFPGLLRPRFIRSPPDLLGDAITAHPVQREFLIRVNLVRKVSFVATVAGIAGL